MPGKLSKAIQLGRAGTFNSDCLDFKSYKLTNLLMINQMLVIKAPNRPQENGPNQESLNHSQGKKVASKLPLFSDNCLLRECQKMLRNRFRL